MYTALWILLSLAVAATYPIRPLLAISAIISFMVMLPYIAVDDLTGSTAHPATFLTVITLVFYGMTKPLVVWGEVARRGKSYFLLGTAMAVLVTTVYIDNGLEDMLEAVRQIVPPICLSVIVSMACHKDMQTASAVRNLLLFFGVVQTILSLLALVVGHPLFYTDQYSQYYWYELGYTRAMGTFDHPLILAMFLLVCTGLAGTIKRWYVKFPLLATYMVGMFLTESRAGLVLSLVVAFIIVASSNLAIDRKYHILLFAAIVMVLLGTSSLAANTTDKFTDDGGSSGARLKALEVFVDNLPTYLLYGVGDATAFADDHGLATSLESVFFIYSVEYGVLFTALFFFAALLMVLPSRIRDGMHPLVYMSIASILLVQTFSSLAAPGATSMLFWLAIGLTSATMDHSTDGNSLGRVDSDPRSPLPLSPAHIAALHRN